MPLRTKHAANIEQRSGKQTHLQIEFWRCHVSLYDRYSSTILMRFKKPAPGQLWKNGMYRYRPIWHRVALLLQLLPLLSAVAMAMAVNRPQWLWSCLNTPLWRSTHAPALQWCVTTDDVSRESAPEYPSQQGGCRLNV